MLRILPSQIPLAALLAVPAAASFGAASVAAVRASEPGTLLLALVVSPGCGWRSSTASAR